ncbi:hypothetical protein [Spiroplasma endosymbiont of Amphibalanus improvisus]|uniref:hypothetical protein n=1 Tax=Spiroplasma endosymbiont of Amphibalanus improvisus TaxID=3066327 RepID=UPI00313E367B
MFKIKNGTKNLFLFCSKCWDYQNFIFSQGIFFDKDLKSVTGNCEKCNCEREVMLQDIIKYYEDVSKDNIFE